MHLQDFVSKLLTVRVRVRLTVEEAMQHEWILRGGVTVNDSV